MPQFIVKSAVISRFFGRLKGPLPPVLAVILLAAGPIQAAKSTDSVDLGGETIAIKDGPRRVDYRKITLPLEKLEVELEGPARFQFSVRQLKNKPRDPSLSVALKWTRGDSHQGQATLDLGQVKGKRARASGLFAMAKLNKQFEVPEGKHTYIFNFEGEGTIAVSLAPARKSRDEWLLPAETEIPAPVAAAPPPPPDPQPESTPAAEPEPVAEPAPAPEPTPPQKTIRLAVMDVQVSAEKLDKVVAESLSSVLAAELKSRGGDRYEIISRADMRSLLKQQVQAQQLGCVEASCAADFGKIASADQIVTASLAALGEGYVFTVQLVEVASGQVLSRQASNWLGDPSGLVELCRPYVARLLGGTESEGLVGDLEIVTNAEGATVHIDDKPLGEAPVAVKRDLSIGAHRVKLVKDGFLPYQTDVVINRGEVTFLQAQLVDESTLQPWYKKWWVWTGATVLVGGAVAAFVFLVPESTTLTIQSPTP